MISADGTVHILIDRAGAIVQDVPVEKLHLSVRAKNSLIRGGYITAAKLIGITYEELKGLQNMGTKTAEEVLEYSKNITAICDVCSTQENSAVTWESLVSEMHSIYGKTENVWLKEILAVKEVFPELTEVLLIRNLYDRPFVHDALKAATLRLIEENGSEISRTDLERKMPHHLTNTSILGKILLELETNAAITINAGTICRRYPSIVEYATSIDNERVREVIRGRIAGKTLQEIGEQYNITREAARQFMQKGLIGRPSLREDKYIYIYDHYDFTFEDFCLTFDEPRETYFYLDMISRVEHKDKLPVDDILTDKAIAPEYRKKAESVVYKNYIAVDSVRVKIKRDDLTRYYIKKYCKNPTHIVDFVTQYHSWLESMGLGGNPSLMIDAGNYTNKLDHKADFVLWRYGENFRYYNIAERDYEELLSTLDLEQFVNTKFSALKLFRDYPELMKQYDIRDEYELHNLLKKIWTPKTINVKFTKMPTIEVGSASVEDQVLALLLQYAPVSAEDLANHYEKEYGVIARTVRANYFHSLNHYLYKGIYSVDYAALPAIQFNRMKSVLDRDFYTIHEVKRIYRQEFPNSNESLLNPYTLKTLGFHVYPGYSGYVVSNKFSGATDYFNAILTQDDDVDMRDYDAAIRNIATYDNELRKLRSTYEIVEKTPLQYVNIRKLNALGITAAHLKKYCEDVSQYISNDEYFTVASLRKNGFAHEIDDLGFEEWFYSSVLLEDREHFSYQRIGGTRIFLCGNTGANLADMLVWIMKKYQKLDFDILVDLLVNYYGIVLPKDKILAIIKDTELCYDLIMETVYMNFDSYRSE